jgi:signal transduction histidine kinase
LPLSIVSAYILSAFAGIEKQRTDSSLLLLLAGKAQTMELELKNAENSASYLAGQMSRDFETELADEEVSAMLLPAMRNVKDNNAAITTVYTVCESGLMRTYPEIDSSVFDEGHDQRSDIFYTIATPENNPEKTVKWTKPYRDYAGHGWIVTCSMPVYAKGSFRGVVCIDMKADILAQSVAGFSLGKSGFAFIITAAGDIIYHPQMESLSPSLGDIYETTYGAIAQSDEMAALMLKPRAGESIINYKSGGQEYAIAYRSLEAADWILGIEVSRSEYQSGERYIYGGLIAMLALLFVLMLLFGFIMHRKITRPLALLAQDVRSIGSGDFKQATYTGNDEIGELGEAFNHMSADLSKLIQSEKMAGTGQMMAGVVHELKNPLSVIKGAAYLLRTNAQNDTVRSAASEIDSNVARAEDIISRVLSFSRKSEPGNRVLSLTDMISQILLLLRQDYAAKNISVSVKAAEDVTIYGNGDAYKHILLNTIGNAIEATDGGGALTIDADTVSSPGRTRIMIANTGQRIAPDVIKHIFEPFFTTKENGTGLGLWIVAKELESIGGKIDIVNAQDGRPGTVTIIDVPAK